MSDRVEVDYVDEAYGTPLVQAYELPLPEQQPRNSTSLALESVRLVFAGAGRLFGFSAYSNKGAAQFIQAFDSLTAPGAGAIPVLVFTVAASSNLGVYWGTPGRWFDRGCFLANSSTAATLTAGGADTWYDAQYTPQVI